LGIVFFGDPTRLSKLTCEVCVDAGLPVLFLSHPWNAVAIEERYQKRIPCGNVPLLSPSSNHDVIVLFLLLMVSIISCCIYMYIIITTDCNYHKDSEARNQRDSLFASDYQ